MSYARVQFTITALLFTLLLACQQNHTVVLPNTTAAAPPVAQLPTTHTVAPTDRPIQTATPSYTPTPTLTPSPTPTPTPTAPSITVEGDPRTAALNLANTNGGPCGLVDLLDFPLSPPDGVGFSGGGDFGTFRSRFGKYHAGEDWWSSNRGNSFGQPVYSVGHGWVTYAEPEGWNRDKGVIIIQHTFQDGSTVLSFYGHLDPPSFLIKAGDCVARGQQIAQIGRPRSSPHLHFEMRTQSPYATLTGYWPTDPTEVGWLPPSQVIWHSRLTAAPGVQWTRPLAPGGRQSVGQVDEQTMAVLEEGQLLGLDLLSGQIRWRYESEESVRAAVLDTHEPLLYLLLSNGDLQALSLVPTNEDGPPVLTAVWPAPVETNGFGVLLPLPDGGAVISTRRALTAISSAGTPLFAANAVSQTAAWLLTDNALLLSVNDGLWRVDTNGAELWPAPAAGKLAQTAAGLWLYTPEGLYTLDWETQTAVLHYILPRGGLSRGDIIALPDGGVLLAHADSDDQRLLAFAADGALRWERSFKGEIEGSVALRAINNAYYLIAEDIGSSSLLVNVYTVDLSGGPLHHLFAGGSRSPSAETWVRTVGEQLWLNIGGGQLVALNPQQALTDILQSGH